MPVYHDYDRDQEENLKLLLKRKGKLKALDQTWHPDSHMLCSVLMDYDENGKEMLIYAVDTGGNGYYIFACLEDVIQWWESGDATQFCWISEKQYKEMEIENG